MTPEAFKGILAAWDEVDRASNRMITALPFQMTEAAERLEAARKAMREVLYASVSSRLAKPAAVEHAEPSK